MDNGADWKSVELRAKSFKADGTENYIHYYYLEKSTHQNRVFNRLGNIIWRFATTGDGRDQVNALDFEETTQKMLFAEDQFFSGQQTGVAKSLCDYMNTLNFTNFVNVINKSSATTIDATNYEK